MPGTGVEPAEFWAVSLLRWVSPWEGRARAGQEHCQGAVGEDGRERGGGGSGHEGGGALHCGSRLFSGRDSVSITRSFQQMICS